MSYGYAPPQTTITAAPPVVVAVGPSIDAATLTFVRTIMESEIQPHPSQALALNAFSTAFQRWNPQTIFDMKPTDQATVDLLFATPPKKATYDDIVKGTIQRHQHVIEALVRKFQKLLESGKLTMKELRAAITTIESPTWKSYKSYSRKIRHLEPIPSIPAITVEMVILEQLQQTIRKLTCVCIQGKTYSIGDYKFRTVDKSKTKTVDVTEKF
jgi:hypothetical protein